MRITRILFSLVLLSITFTPIQSALAADLVSADGGWALSYPDFSKSLTDDPATCEWTISPRKNNSLSEFDKVTIYVQDSSGNKIDSNFEFPNADNDPSISISTDFYSEDAAKLAGQSSLLVTMTIGHHVSDSASITENFTVPLTTFPKRPSSFSGYVSLPSDFSTLIHPFPSSQDWFDLAFTLNDPFGDVDHLTFSLQDSSGKELSNKVDSLLDTGENTTSIAVVPMDLFNGNGKYQMKMELAFDPTLKLPPLTSTVPFQIVTPKKPSSFADFLQFSSDFSTVIHPNPSNCGDANFQYTVNDPYGEIDSINFSLRSTAYSNELDSTGVDSITPGVMSDKFFLCGSALTQADGKYQVTATITLKSQAQSKTYSATVPFAFENLIAESQAKLTSMGRVCTKASKFTVVKKGNCPAGYKEIVFTTPDQISWNKFSRTPDALKGKNFAVYGCVAQFDVNTGGSQFRGYLSPTNPNSAYSGVNTLFSGNAKSLLVLSEGDKFLAKVYVQGGTSYSSLGGSKGVPAVLIRDFVKLGTC